MSLTTDDIEDIKQLLVANNRTLLEEFDRTLDQKLDQKLEEKLEQKFKEKLAPIHQKIDDLDQKIDDLTDFVRESFDITNDANGEQFTDHEARITKLEQATAA